MNSNSKNILTYSMMGTGAYMLADVVHEVLGHASACLLIGQHITLLTSVYFRSTPGSVITDLAGPLLNLITGLIILTVILKKKDLSTFTHFFLLLALSFNFFWFSGTILQSAFSRTGDWTYIIKKLNVGTLGKPLLFIVGAAAYYYFIKLIRTKFLNFNLKYSSFPLRRNMFNAYRAAAFAAFAAGLLFSPDRLHAGIEGLLEVVASLPVLFIKLDEKPKEETFEIKNSIVTNIVMGFLFIIFCLTLGRGFIF